MLLQFFGFVFIHESRNVRNSFPDTQDDMLDFIFVFGFGDVDLTVAVLASVVVLAHVLDFNDVFLKYCWSLFVLGQIDCLQESIVGIFECNQKQGVIIKLRDATDEPVARVCQPVTIVAQQSLFVGDQVDGVNLLGALGVIPCCPNVGFVLVDLT